MNSLICQAAVHAASDQLANIVIDVTDFAGDPGGETITEAGEVQVDVAARERFPGSGP